ncbi:MAG: hypothetical protein DMD84_27465, partial [Candidatus Rokuibacteriota bacterium]
LQALPYPDAAQLVVLSAARGDQQQLLISVPEAEDWRARNRTLTDIGIQRTQSVNLTGTEAPDRLVGSYVTASTLHILGARVTLGRLFGPEETLPGSGQRVVILSAAAWKTRFGADSSVLGRSVTLDGRPHRVIGVLSDAFRDPFSPVEVFLPIASAPSQSWFTRGSPSFWAFGRLKTGVTLEQAQGDLSRVAHELAQEYPSPNANTGASVRRLRDSIVGPVRDTLLIVLAFVAVVLLIACANVANVQLARAVSRSREMSLRAALGAGRARLVRQLLTESVVLASLGGVAGVLAARWAIGALVALVPDGLPSVVGDVGLAPGVLAFAVAITAAASLLFGAAPALRASRGDLRGALQNRGGALARHGRVDPRLVLVSAELALCVVLLIGAGLLTRSLRALTRVDPGFNPANVLTAEFRLPRARYASDQSITTFMTQALEQIRAVPGVRDAALVQSIPLSGNWGTTTYVPDTRPSLAPDQAIQTQLNVVSEGAFRVLGVPVVEGREFTAADAAGSVPVAVVNQELARRTWPGRSALGRRLRISGPPDVWATVIGVVGTIRQRTLREAPSPQLYRPMTQAANIFNSIAARTDGEPMALARSVRAALWSVDPEQPVWRMRSMASLLERDVATPKVIMLLTTLFASLALLLAVIGVYGVVSYVVAERTREVGIRMALGARSGEVVRLFVGRGLRAIGVATATGLAAALAGARVLRAQLYGVSPTDLATFVAVPVILAAVAVLACWLPSRRAARVDPMVALRYE